jgi:phage repressor protein C with HTH and peptisase S24 domain
MRRISCCSVAQFGGHQFAEREFLALLLRQLNERRPMLHWNTVPLHPPLNGGMIAVAKRTGDRPHPAEVADDLLDGTHSSYVRYERTNVNGAIVPCSGDTDGMAAKSVGDQLIALRKRSGLTLDQVAKRMKLGGRSSVQRFFTSELDEITIMDAMRLADVFAGLGNPPIDRTELLSLTHVSNLFEVRPNETLAPRYMQLPLDVPVYGTAMGTFREAGDGPAIEQTLVDRSDTIDHFTRPPGYANRTGLYGLYVQGSSMEPRWDQGDPIYVDPKRPPLIGDDVVVYLVRNVDDSDELEAVLLKRLVKRTAGYVELQQYNPALTFQVETRRIAAMHRVIPRRELLTFN